MQYFTLLASIVVKQKAHCPHRAGVCQRQGRRSDLASDFIMQPQSLRCKANKPLAARWAARDNAPGRKAKREMDLIREYRTRLIADVVTGKLDVCDLAPVGPTALPGDKIDEDQDLADGIDEEEILDDDEPELAEAAVDVDES